MKRTLEIVCYFLSGSIFLVLLVFVAILSYFWFKSETFTPAYLFSVLIILAFSMSAQFLIVFYSSGFMGLNQQVALNLINILLNTVKCVGAYLTVIYAGDKIRAFLIFQALVAVLQIIILKIALTKITSVDEIRGQFKWDVLKRLKKFTSELFLNNLAIILLTQSDKIILSKVLNLKEFGYYMLAYTITTMTLSTFSNSIYNVVFPNFSRLAMQEKQDDLLKNYKLSNQLMTWGAVSISVILVLFSKEILMVWAGNPEVAEKTGALLSIYALGFGLNSIALIPYYLQLAFGTSRISFGFNLISFLLVTPALIWASYFYGAQGAVWCWLVLNAVYFVVFIPVIRKNFLPFSLKDLYLKDVGKIVFTGLTVGLIFRVLIPENLSRISLFLVVGACFAIIAGLTFLMTDLREFALRYGLFHKLKSKFL